MAAFSWPRLQLAASALVGLAALCAGATWFLPLPPDALPYVAPPPPLHDALDEPDIAALERAHQVRGMKALDQLLEARLAAEVPGAEPPPSELRSAGVEVGPDAPEAEALLVAWGDAFRAHGLKIDGTPVEEPE